MSYTVTKYLTRPNTSIEWPEIPVLESLGIGGYDDIKSSGKVNIDVAYSTDGLTQTTVFVWSSKEEYTGQLRGKDTRDSKLTEASVPYFDYIASNNITGWVEEEDGTVKVFNSTSKAFEVEQKLIMFNHTPVDLPPVKARNSDGVRLYETPEGNKYPSLTTVLSIRNKKGLHEWRKRVGNEVANYVARTSAARGTKVHHMCEDFLNNEFDEDKHKKDFLPYCLFNQLKEQALCNIDNIYAQEAGLYSDKYKVAGRVDCIARYNGTPSIIDFKTSSRERTDDWNENYYIQGSAYAEMFGE